ncbi:MAG: rhomboid family intramembrane serine protease, partial [Planctomycetota bacterium]
ERIGSRRLVRFYLLAGICGGVFWLIFSALTGQGIPCVGASGAVYGIVAYAALMNPRARVIMIIVVIPLWVVAAVLAAGAIVSTLASLRLGAGTGVADAAHLGGMAYALVRWRFGPQMAAWRLRFEGLMRERERGRRRARENELDRLLQKIKEVGMGGLSSSERRFLSRYSKDERK